MTLARNARSLPLRRRHNQGGFSLIEMMVVMVIAAVLFGLALPAYTSYMQKTRRTDAKVALTTIAAQQERYFLKNNQYAGSTTALGYSANPHISDEGYYSVVVTTTDGSDFTATATAIGVQDEDADCATLTIADTGQKTAQSEGAADTSSVCW